MPERRLPEQRGDLIDRLREADAVYAEQRISPAAKARLEALVGGRGPAPGRRRWALAAVPVAIAALLTLALLVRPWQAERPTPAPRVAGFDVISGAARQPSASPSVLRCESARCRLQPVGVASTTELALERGTRLRRRGGDVELLAGRMRCAVRKRPAGRPPLRIHVSHGRIEVVGTRFVLQQDRDRAGGHVLLERGAIRFVDRDDPTRVVNLRPGERLSWPLPPVATSADARPAPGGADGGDTEDDAEDDGGPRTRRGRRRADGGATDAGANLLVRVERLRARGRYGEAVSLLRRGLSRVKGRAARERLSYELGAILTHQLGDRGRACKHWRGHLRRFGGRRYGEQISTARRQLGCEPSGDETKERR